MSKNKVLVTGVSRGIGRSICEKLVKEGYFVFGTYNTGVKEAKELKSKLKNVDILQVDFLKRKNTIEFIKTIKKENIYALVNNAGTIIFEDWNNFKMDSWDKTLEVNLNTPMLLCHTLRDSIQDGGSIVNIASTDGMIGSITSIAYSASKAALINLTQSLTNVFADRKIRVNTISPGFVGGGMDSPALKDAKWINPLNRTADYKEIANVVNFLISEDASFVNGENLVVDGGTRAVDYFLKKESELVQ